MTARDLLLHFLANDDPRLSPLKAALGDAEPCFLDVSSGDGAPLFRIYSVRAELAKDKGSETKGYDDLLANLKLSQDRSVSVLNVNSETKAFLLFFESGNKRLLGLLYGDRKH